MSWNRGYLPPGTIPGGFVCRVIWIPDAPECVQAAWDSYSRVTSPGRWQTDFDYASAIGQVWQQAVSLTLQTWDSEDCGMVSQEVINGIISRLEELENMNICVNCGCCNCNNNQNNIPNDDTFPPGENPPPTGNTSTSDSVWLCNASYDVTGRFIQFWQNVKDYASVGVSASVLEAILDGLVIFFSFGQPVAVLMSYIGQFLTEAFANSLISLFTNLRPAIISAIRTATNAAAAETAVKNLVWSSPYPLPQRAAAYALVDLGNWDMVYTPESWSVPDNENCSEIVPPGTCWLPTGYDVQRANQYVEDTASEFTVSSTITPNAGTDDCGSYSSANYTALLSATNQTWEVVLRAMYLQEVNEAIGYVITVEFNEAIGGNSPSIPVARVSFSLEPNPPPYYSFDEYAVFRFVAVKAAHMSAFEPLIGGAIGELQQITDNDWDFETEWVHHKLYKRSGVSNNQFGGVGISIKFQYIYPS